jgi:multisubunit Na+/H+ antiporter MnhB subunit
MSLIVRTVTRVTIGIIFLFGIYLALHGHLTPGGGFAGGIIIALVYILYTLAYGKAKADERLIVKWDMLFLSLGLWMFLGLALAGFGWNYFLSNFLPKGKEGEIISGGFIPFSNIAVMIEMGAGILAVFLCFIIFRVSFTKKGDE